ncbi:hypothetical protein Tco_1335748 [Tanacetum coccineum]
MLSYSDEGGCGGGGGGGGGGSDSPCLSQMVMVSYSVGYMGSGSEYTNIKSTRKSIREISRREGVNREGNVSKRRKYLSPRNKSVKTTAEEFLKKAIRELLGDNKSFVKGPFKLQDSDKDDGMSAEPIMFGYIKVSVISCIPAGIRSVWIRVLVGLKQINMLETRIKILEARLELERHLEDRACQSGSILYELLDGTENLRMDYKVNDLKINILETRIKVLEARLELKRHPEDRVRQLGAILYELLDDMENIRID